MVGDVVLSRIGARAWIACNLAVGGQDVIRVEAGRIDEVAAVVVLHCSVLAYRQLVACGIVDVRHGAGRAARDGLREFKRVVGHCQAAETVRLHRAIGIVRVGFVRPVALERPQLVCPTGIGINQ